MFNSTDLVQSFSFRMLAAFGFNLDYNHELQKRKNPVKTVTESVKDILITHHLFSWELC